MATIGQLSSSGDVHEYMCVRSNGDLTTIAVNRRNLHNLPQEEVSNYAQVVAGDMPQIRASVTASPGELINPAGPNWGFKADLATDSLAIVAAMLGRHIIFYQDGNLSAAELPVNHYNQPAADPRPVRLRLFGNHWESVRASLRMLESPFSAFSTGRRCARLPLRP